MQINAALDRLHARVVRVAALQYFTAVTRVLLAVAFLPSGLKKVLNERFTSLPVSNPVGFFFEAFYRSGVWYQFVGWAQLTAALLLLFPRTAALGAMLYLPIAVNVALVTIGVGFQGTPYITVLMALGALYLVCWEYDRWRDLLPRLGRAVRTPTVGRPAYLPVALAWAAAGAAAFGAIYASGIGNLHRTRGLLGFPVLATMGALFGLVTTWHARRMEVRVPAPSPAD
jgi:hypothetical protein